MDTEIEVSTGCFGLIEGPQDQTKEAVLEESLTGDNAQPKSGGAVSGKSGWTFQAER